MAQNAKNERDQITFSSFLELFEKISENEIYSKTHFAIQFFFKKKFKKH